MATIETPRQEIKAKEMPILEVKTKEIESLLQRLEKYTVGESKDDPTSELMQAQSLLAEAEQLGIKIDEFKAKITEISAKYYDENISRLLGQLEKRIKSEETAVRMSSYLLITQIGQMIGDAKKFGVDVLEENDRLNKLEKLVNNTIKI